MLPSDVVLVDVVPDACGVLPPCAEDAGARCLRRAAASRCSRLRRAAADRYSRVYRVAKPLLEPELSFQAGCRGSRHELAMGRGATGREKDRPPR
jgi:hypothetical protein